MDTFVVIWDNVGCFVVFIGNIISHLSCFRQTPLYSLNGGVCEYNHLKH